MSYKKIFKKLVNNEKLSESDLKELRNVPDITNILIGPPYMQNKNELKMNVKVN